MLIAMNGTIGAGDAMLPKIVIWPTATQASTVVLIFLLSRLARDAKFMLLLVRLSLAVGHTRQ